MAIMDSPRLEFFGEVDADTGERYAPRIARRVPAPGLRRRHSASELRRNARRACRPGGRFSPLVVRGDTVFSALMSGQLEATLISTGQVLWRVQLREGAFEWTPREFAVTTDLIIAGISQSVLAVRRSDGSIAWRYDAPAESAAILASTHIVTDGQYVAFGQRNNEATVLNAATGAVVWERHLLPSDESSWTRTFAMANGVLVYGRTRGMVPAPDGAQTVFAVHVSDGAPLWDIRIDSAAGITDWSHNGAIVANGAVVFTLGDGAIVSSALASGAIKWIRPLPVPDYDWRYMVIDGNELLATYTSSGGGAQSLDVTTGVVNWTAPSPVGSPMSSAAVGPSTLAYSVAGGQLVLMNRSIRQARYINAYEIQLEPGVFFFPTATYVNERLLAPSSAGLVILTPERR